MPVYSSQDDYTALLATSPTFPIDGAATPQAGNVYSFDDAVATPTHELFGILPNGKPQIRKREVVDSPSEILEEGAPPFRYVYTSELSKIDSVNVNKYPSGSKLNVSGLTVDGIYFVSLSPGESLTVPGIDQPLTLSPFATTRQDISLRATSETEFELTNENRIWDILSTDSSYDIFTDGEPVNVYGEQQTRTVPVQYGAIRSMGYDIRRAPGDTQSLVSIWGGYPDTDVRYTILIDIDSWSDGNDIEILVQDDDDRTALLTINSAGQKVANKTWTTDRVDQSDMQMGDFATHLLDGVLCVKFRVQCMNANATKQTFRLGMLEELTQSTNERRCVFVGARQKTQIAPTQYDLINVVGPTKVYGRAPMKHPATGTALIGIEVVIGDRRAELRDRISQPVKFLLAEFDGLNVNAAGQRALQKPASLTGSTVPYGVQLAITSRGDRLLGIQVDDLTAGQWNTFGFIISVTANYANPV